MRMGNLWLDSGKYCYILEHFLHDQEKIAVYLSWMENLSFIAVLFRRAYKR